MSTTDQDIQNSGLKATAPRRVILDLFRRQRHQPGAQHMTAEDVHRLLHSEGRDIAVATIYRVLTQFEQAGILSRHHFESGKAVFELNDGQHHDHLVCLQCGKVEEFFDAEIERRQTEIAARSGFAIVAHEMYLYADCCRAECPHKTSPAAK